MNDNRKILHSNARRNLADIQMGKLEIKIDITTLNMIIAFIYKDSVLRTRKALSNIFKLFNSLDKAIYDASNVEVLDRYWIIETTLYARLVEGFTNDDLIRQYCKDREDCDEYKSHLIDILSNSETTKITYEDSKYLLKMIDERLKFGYTITLKHIIEDLFSALDESDVKTYRAIAEDLYEISTSIINIKRNANSIGSEQTFSLQEEVFQTVIEEAVEKLRNRNRIFVTGIQRLNSLLSPGYQSPRLYVYLAFPGGGKSQLLLKAAIDIRKYNSGIICNDPDKRPAVLFITMENTIEETVERIFNMVSSDDDIRNFTPKQVQRMLRDRGQLKLTDKDNIDIIIKYYDNRSIDTNDIYGIIQDLEDDGIECVALILDYLKRIRPAERGKDEKEELKNITNELKTLAKHYQIPVITAQQLNRAAAAVVDMALQSQKSDVTKLVGRDGIAGAWEIQENADMTIVINREKRMGTGEMYMAFKLLKRRYRSSESDDNLRELEFFHHPYVQGSSIRLDDDIDDPVSKSLTSLMDSLDEPDVTKRGKKNATERKKKDEEVEELYEVEEFSPFDIKRSVY